MTKAKKRTNSKSEFRQAFQADRRARQARARARAQTARAEDQALRKSQARAARADLKRLRSSYPSISTSGTKKKGGFDFKAIFSEIKTKINPKLIPKLKKPEKAGKKTKKVILGLYDEIRRREARGMAYFTVKGAKRRNKVARIFDPEDNGQFKGAWISKARAGDGKALIRFDKQGNPILKFGRGLNAPEGVFFELDLADLVKNPEGYIRGLVRNMGADTLFFPVDTRGNELKRHGAGLDTIPTIWEVLERLMQQYGNTDQWLNGLVAYPLPR